MSYENHLKSQNILISLISASVLLEKNSPGPACKDVSKRIMEEIATLRDENRLYDIDALKDAGKMHLIRFKDLYQFYADQNTEGLGTETFEALNEWGAFNGAMTQELRQSDEEVNRYLYLNNLRALNDIHADEASKYIASKTSFIIDDEEIMRGVQHTQALINYKNAGASDDQLLDAYTKLGIGQGKGRVARVLIEAYGRKARLENQPKPPAANPKPSQRFKR